jgi:hypothetical protein
VEKRHFFFSKIMQLFEDFVPTVSSGMSSDRTQNILTIADRK